MNNEKLIMKNYGVALRATDFTTHPVGKADTPPQGMGNTSPSASYPRPKKVAERPSVMAVGNNCNRPLGHEARERLHEANC